MPITLVSPALCHYAQHTAIALSEKGVPFKRRIVHLSRKPDWFVAISPLGRTPVLKVGDGALFESAAILDYLGVTLPDPLHPKDPLERARDCASIGFGSECLSDIAGFYSARVAQTFLAWAASIHARLRVLEKQLGNAPWFGGDRFRPVDAVFPPVFRYSDTFEAIGDFGISDGLGKVPEWRPNLATWTSVLDAVGADYGERLEKQLGNAPWFGGDGFRPVAAVFPPFFATLTPSKLSAISESPTAWAKYPNGARTLPPGHLCWTLSARTTANVWSVSSSARAVLLRADCRGTFRSTPLPISPELSKV